MKTEEKCSICGKTQPVSQMGEYWKGASMFQLRPKFSCHDEKNCNQNKESLSLKLWHQRSWMLDAWSNLNKCLSKL